MSGQVKIILGVLCRVKLTTRCAIVIVPPFSYISFGSGTIRMNIFLLSLTLLFFIAPNLPV